MENKFIKALKETQVLQEEKYTFKEYVSQLQEFQRLIVNAIYQEDIHEDEAHLDEAISELGKLCRRNNIDPKLASSVKGALKSVNKELAINMAGIKSEEDISNKINSAKRKNAVNFRNVYLNDGINETEIDNVVLTDEGIIIFEVKSAKSDMKIDKSGRLLRDGHVCYDKMPITRSMELKRNMLGLEIEKILAERNLYMPNLYIESYIAFSTPSDKTIEVTDESGLEEFCFGNDIPSIIDSDLKSGFIYDGYEFDTMKKILEGLNSDMKFKENRIDPQRIIYITVNLLEMIYPEMEEVPKVTKSIKKEKDSNINLMKLIASISLPIIALEAATSTLFSLCRRNSYR